MRTSWWAYLFVAVLTCSAAYRHFDQPSVLAEVVRPSEQPERNPLAQELERPVTDKDSVGLDERQVENTASAPAALDPDALASAPTEARLEDATRAITTERSERNDTKKNLSYLAYYAYSEVAPETKPADIVLDSLKSIPLGTAVAEIKLVSGALGLDFTFMKTVAKVESGFDPKQRTGSYIGLFQLSKSEFGKYGAGDILNARHNAVAAALKFMSEAIEFQMFTKRTPSLNDVYLIHQQGVDGAAEHLSHPHRLAWRSMCATGEGRDKGEKWCKRAIWGNTLPAFKRVWKNVNNVTSDAFVAMWRRRVSEFYARYSEAPAP